MQRNVATTDEWRKEKDVPFLNYPYWWDLFIFRLFVDLFVAYVVQMNEWIN